MFALGRTCCLIIYITAAALLTGCTMTPRYERAQAPIAASYPLASKNTMPEFIDSGWREFFPDSRLQILMATALKHNKDLCIAALNMKAAMAQYNITKANTLPNLGANADLNRAHTPSTRSLTGGENHVTNAYNVGLNIPGFELDFWGRIKSLKEAALAQYLSTVQAQQAAHISLISQIARTYLSDIALVEEETLAQKTLDSRLNNDRLTAKRFEVGAVSNLDVSISKSLVESARISLANIENERGHTQHALTLLMGKPLNDRELPPAKSLGEQGIIADLSTGLPSSLLTRRPDILAAEQQLISANANIDAARAAFFPTISLTAAFGYSSFDLKNLFQGINRSWSFMPKLTVPIFTSGRLSSSLNLAEVQKDIAVENYEKTIQVAFKEVSDALSACEALQKQLVAQKKFQKLQEERVKLTVLRYKNGIDSASDMFNAQRDLFSSQQTLIQINQQYLVNAVNLYAALGGGLHE